MKKQISLNVSPDENKVPVFENPTYKSKLCLDGFLLWNDLAIFSVKLNKKLL